MGTSDEGWTQGMASGELRTSRESRKPQTRSFPCSLMEKRVVGAQEGNSVAGAAFWERRISPDDEDDDAMLCRIDGGETSTKRS